MRISVTVEPSETSRRYEFDLDELGTTEDEWNAMSAQEQETFLNEYLEDLSEQPYWMVDRFSEKD